MATHPTSKLTGGGGYIQPSIQSIKLRNTLPALGSNDLFGGIPAPSRLPGQVPTQDAVDLPKMV